MGNREAFFEHWHSQFTYFGYSDIQLRTERVSDVDIGDVDISGQVSTRRRLRVPILGSPMNTVSEKDMAIAMGKLGGGAIIHHANTPEEQADMVRDVKLYLNGIIDSPITAYQDQSISSVLQRLDKMGKDFRTLPVLDDEDKCVGLMTGNLFKVFDPSTPVREAMLPYGRFAVADAGITPQAALREMRDQKSGVLTLVDSFRRIGGLCLTDDILRVVDSNPDEFSLDEDGQLITFMSVPPTLEEAIERIDKAKKYIDVVNIDTSHGEHKRSLKTLTALLEKYHDSGIDILPGNISTEQTAIEVAKLEPDGTITGQGPGQICKSSDRLGFGTPQASAGYEVSKGTRSVNHKIPTIADGGIGDSADTLKAFAVGANGVKVGGLIAGTDEAPGDILRDPETGAPYKLYYGMGSRRAQEAFAAARARYGNFSPTGRIFEEGFEKKVALKGPVAEVIEDHVLGVKLGMAALGVSNQEELREHASFMSGSNKKN
jgi:IMP dehydrogenase